MLKEIAERLDLQISFEKTEYMTGVIQEPKSLKTKNGIIKKGFLNLNI